MTYSPFRFLPALVRIRRPLHLTFFVTRRCNARCGHCFYVRDRSGAPGGREMSIEEIELFSRSLGSLLWLALSGGEIFLRHDLAEICRVFYRNNRPSIILLPTNAMDPERIRKETAAILRDCPRSTVAVKLSMDALGERHDRLRGVRHSFRNVLRTYENLSPLLDSHPNLELGVNTVFLKENQDEMGEIISFVRGLEHVQTHTISLVRGDVGHDVKDVDLDKYLEAVKLLDRDAGERRYRFRGARIKAAQDNIQRRLIHRTLVERRGQLPCYAGRLNVVVTETGDVYPCELLKRGMGSLGRFGHDMGRLLGSEEAKRVVSQIRKGCYCSHECNMMTNILFNPALYPALAREYLKAFSRRGSG